VRLRSFDKRILIKDHMKIFVELLCLEVMGHAVKYKRLVTDLLKIFLLFIMCVLWTLICVVLSSAYVHMFVSIINIDLDYLHIQKKFARMVAFNKQFRSQNSELFFIRKDKRITNHVDFIIVI